jgi:transposase
MRARKRRRKKLAWKPRDTMGILLRVAASRIFDRWEEARKVEAAAKAAKTPPEG